MWIGLELLRGGVASWGTGTGAPLGGFDGSVPRRHTQTIVGPN
jgi:hypothetical protein